VPSWHKIITIKMAKPKVPNKKESAPVKSTQLKREPARDFTINFIPEKFQTPVFLAVILILIIIFFKSGLFDGKVFSSGDNIASSSFNTFLDDAKKEGIFPLWVPYIFDGMPSFAALTPQLERMYDFSQALWVYVRDSLYAAGGNNPVWCIVLFYIIFAFSFYFLALYKFKDKLIALYCAVAAVFITPIIQLIIVGHNSKMIAAMMYPAILLFIEKIYDLFTEGNLKQNIFRLLLYFTALTFFLHVQMSSNHIQMLFYFYFATGIYFGYKLIYSLVKKVQVSSAVKVIGVFILAAGISGMMYADSYLSVKEYNKYSIRGVPAITQQTQPGQNSAQPLDYEYATNWSFSPTEVMTFFIPYWVGFGDVEVNGQRTNTYWGQMPFNTLPMYFGVITILFGIIGIYYNFRKYILVQALTIISFIALILSFGRTLPVLFDLMFYHFPFFSSFRAPVMIHILINISFVILAGFGIKSIIETAKDRPHSAGFLNAAKYVFPLLALPILISFIGFEGYYTSQVSSSPLIEKLHQQGANPQQIQQYVSKIASVAYANVKSEMLVIGFLLLLAYGACYLFIKGQLKYQVFLIAIILFTIADLWHIDFKTLHWDNKTDNEAVFKTPDYVDWMLKNDKNTYEYRVFDMQNLTTNIYAYWRLQSINGYQGAKLRIYQDMIDVAEINNPMVWKLMSTKYFIADKPYQDSSFTVMYKGSKYILKNNNFLPKAFFVSSYKTAQGIEILNNIKQENFDPRQVAFLEKDPGIKADIPDSTVKVQITGYDIHNINLDAEASGNNLLYLSEVYYPVGWNAYIDGSKTEIYKTDYLFRSIIVPKGKHKIEFKFEPETYYMGKKVSIGANLFLIIIFGISLGGIIIRRKKVKDIPQV
jgi:hypothetical protein